MTEEQRKWCKNADVRGGSFVKSFVKTLFLADDINFLLLEPILNILMKKYPYYNISEPI